MILSVASAGAMYVYFFVATPGDVAAMTSLEKCILIGILFAGMSMLYLVLGTYGNPHIVPGGERLLKIRNHYRNRARTEQVGPADIGVMKETEDR